MMKNLPFTRPPCTIGIFLTGEKKKQWLHQAEQGESMVESNIRIKYYANAGQKPKKKQDEIITVTRDGINVWKKSLKIKSENKVWKKSLKKVAQKCWTMDPSPTKSC